MLSCSHCTIKLSDAQYMNSMKTCPSVTFYFMKNSFSDVSRKWILPNMIRAGRASFHGIHERSPVEEKEDLNFVAERKKDKTLDSIFMG